MLVCSAEAGSAVDLRAELGGDGDITALIQRMRRTGATRGFLSPGRYSVAPGTSIDRLAIEGAGRDTVICPGTARASNYLFEARGSLRPLPPLASSARSMEMSLLLRLRPLCEPGDIVVIFNPRESSFSTARPVYRAGQFATVARVEGTRLHLTSPLDYDVEGAVNQLALLVPARARLASISFETGKSGALVASLSRELVLEDVNVLAAAPHGIYLDRCYGFEVQDAVIENLGSGSASDYGLAIGNSQAGRIVGGAFYGRRHGISLGGGDFPSGVPSRSISIEQARIANHSAAGTPAADMHGNCVAVSYRGCSIKGGALVGGRDGSYLGCDISAMTNGTCIYGTEMLGGTFVVRECVLRSENDPSKGFRGVIDIGGNSIAVGPHTQGPIRLIVQDSSVLAKGLSNASRIVEVRNRGTRFPIDVTVTGLSLDVNALGSVVSTRDHGANRRWNGRIEISGVRGKPSTACDHLERN